MNPPNARQLAFRVLRRVEEQGAYASVLLDRWQGRLGDFREAALARELVLGILRQRAALDHALRQVARRPPERTDPPVLTALRIGAYGLLFLDRTPDFAAVDTAVELIRRDGPRSATGFVNGALRNLARGGADHLPNKPSPGDTAGLAIYRSHPRWWVERVVQRLGWERADRLLAANNEPAPAMLRPNLRKTTPEALAEALASEGLATEPGRFVPVALRLRRGAVQRTRALPEGLAWIQDEASQLVASLLGTSLSRVADVCAAPGGKTLVLAQGLGRGGFVVATDRHAGRMKRLSERLHRLGVTDVLPAVADMAARHVPLRGPFDQVLVDAPCTGTGTLRRHPEIRWRLRPTDPPRLARLQSRLLDSAATLVGPGGATVYAVCSLEPEEGDQVLARFLSRHSDFRIADPRDRIAEQAHPLVDKGNILRTSPLDAVDGFFAVLLEKR